MHRYRYDNPPVPPVPLAPLPIDWNSLAHTGLSTAASTLAATVVSNLVSWGFDALRDKFDPKPEETKPEIK